MPVYLRRLPLKGVGRSDAVARQLLAQLDPGSARARSLRHAGMEQALVRSRQTTCAFVHLPARRGEAAPTLPPPRAGLVEVLRFARAMSSAESSSARPSVRRAAMAAEKSLAPQPRCDA